MGIRTPVEYIVPGAHPILNPNGILIGSARFCRVTVPGRQTDHATQSVATGRIYVRSRPLLGCGLIIICGLNAA